VAAADPLNLVGIVVPGERVAAVPGKEVRYRNGSLILNNGQEGNGSALFDAKILPIRSARRPFEPPLPPAIPAELNPPATTLF
jgi:hypothetical protein